VELAHWSTFAGVLLIVMALSGSLLARLPLSTAMLYLAVGAAASPLWLSWSTIGLQSDVQMIEWLAEVVVLLSLFTSGLKMSTGLSDGRWLLPVRLAFLSMLVTVALVAGLGYAWLGLPIGAAILLGAILAPTDPVLASDVQIAEPGDRDKLRFALTGEAGLNDGTAFPFVMLGLGLLGLHELGTDGWRWIAVDVVWAVVGGIAIGAGLGTLVGRLVIYLRRTHHEAVGLDNFIGLGLVFVAYGIALLLSTYGFLAVFAAGLALRRAEKQATQSAPASVANAQDGSTARIQSEERHHRADRAKPADPAQHVDPDDASADFISPAALAIAHADPAIKNDELTVHPQHGPAFMAHAVLSFNEQLERIGEVVVVIAIGMLLWAVDWSLVSWWFVAAMLLVVRPVSVWLGLRGSTASRSQRRLVGWFGIRGIGSLYYLAYALNHGVEGEIATTLIASTLSLVVVSIVVHGISVTPLMKLYEARRNPKPS
jgi:sodium/hydrogen antiporter